MNQLDKALIIHSGEKHYEIIDFAKGFSIISIVIMHLIQGYTDLPQLIKTVLSLGGTGVHLFFFCSGFGLYLSWMKHPLTYKQFLLIRFSKVYMPYVFVIIISYFTPFMYKAADRFIALLSHLFLFKMFVPKYEESFGGQMWYISTLFQFYLLFPMFVYLKEKMKNRFLYLSLIMSLSWWIFSTLLNLSSMRIWGSFFLQYLWEFSLGMIIAEYLNECNKSLKLKGWLIIIVAIFGIGLEAILALKGGPMKSFNDIPAFFGFFALICAIWLYSNKMTKLFINKVSEISFEWYLTHILCFNTIFFLFEGKVLTYIIPVLAFTGSIVLAFITKIIIERSNIIYEKFRYG